MILRLCDNPKISFFYYVNILILLIPCSYLETIHVASAAAMDSITPERPICLYYMSKEVQSHSDNDPGGDQLLGDGTVLCSAPSDYCFSFWKIIPINGTTPSLGANGVMEVSSDTPGFSWLARGCFKNAHSCHRESCVATEREVEDNYFCCCKGSRCNEQISFQQATILPEAAHSDIGSGGSSEGPLSASSFIAVISLFVLVLFAVFSFAGFRRYRRNRKSLSETPLGFDKSPTSPCIDLSNLKFLEEIGHGRYGTVRRAMLGDEEVAVKLFLLHHKSSFNNEKYIYSLPLMEHPSLLTFLGGGEIYGPDKNPYLGLVLSFCPQGKLCTYLQHNTLDWVTFCRVITSAVKGLGHLHSEYRKGDLIKPCVAHRDFNTRNILLKDDMSCVVSDLGFAIHTQGAKFYINGEEQLAEMASLTDVGTMRYMAPEVLEGAVNLRDCETSLKQIDIYALGLVLWEVAYRCHDLYQGTQTPPYALPFQAEIGLSPSFEQMQVLVARNKARPLFPQIWKDCNPAVRQLKETIEDCWDNDAEARLSAMCVEKRLQELRHLWERYKASLGVNGISPTTNPSSGGFMVNMKAGDFNNSFIISNELCLMKDKHNRDSSMSENTCETTVPFSPSDPAGRVFGKNHYVEAVQVIPPLMLQPHQGRNPCMERNTISEPKFSGTQLVKASDKFSHNSSELGLTNVNLVEVLEAQHGIDANMLMNEHLVPLLNSFLPASQQAPPVIQAVPSPPASLPVVPPIPYLQNETRSEGRPKQQNVMRDVDKKMESSSSWRKWKAAWEERLMVLLPRLHNRQECEDEEQQNILITPTSSSFSEPPTPLAPFHSSASQQSQMQSPLHQTQVHLSNGTAQTIISDRLEPSYISASHNTPIMQTNFAVPVTSRPLIAETEIGIAKLQIQPGLAPVVRSRQGSKDSGINKSSDTSSATSFIDSDSSLDKVRRPMTLLLQVKNNRNFVAAHTSDDDIGSDVDGGPSADNIKLRKPKQRIRTPKIPVNPRLSLYDDSLMAGNHGTGLLEANMSRSLPLNMNTVVEHTGRNSLNVGGDKSSSSISSIKQGARSDSTSSGHSTSESSSVCPKEELDGPRMIIQTSGLEAFNSAIVAHV